jgi:hypothetical protein
MNKLFYIVLAAILATGCGGEDGESDSEKGLFSYWEDIEGEATPLDLSDGSFSGYRDISFFYADGAQCDCHFRVFGSEDRGNYSINTCRYAYASSADGDPGCDALNHTGTYSKTRTELTVCDSEQECTTYE